MKRVKFGDIVREVKVQVDRNNNPYMHYVAGDHMDSMDLTIRRKGSFATDDVGPAFIRIFKPGQVLYGSRRTYLKKIAVADFEGICSNTTFVLETKDSNVFLQELLPFIMLSESFTKWSISHSKGSTNPYVLFSDLANYEFTLPSLSEQKVLADKLWAAYRVKESYKKLLAATDDMLKAKFMEMFGEEKNISLENIAITWSKGQSFSKNDIVDEGKTPCIHYGQLYKYGYVINNVFSATNASAKATSTRGDILFPASDVTPRGLARCSCIDLDGVILGGDIIVMHPIEGIDSIYLSYAINQQTNQLLQLVTGSVVRHMSAKSLKTVKVPLPPLPLQQQFVEIAIQAEATKESLRKSIENIDQVIKSLINQ